MNNETGKSATPITDHLRATGEWNPNWTPFAELDPVWTEKFMEMGLRPMISGVLDPKTIEFLAIAVATREEITAVLQLTSVLGIHTMSLSAPILQEELAALEAANNSTAA